MTFKEEMNKLNAEKQICIILGKKKKLKRLIKKW